MVPSNSSSQKRKPDPKNDLQLNSTDFDVRTDIERLEEIIIESRHIPFTRYTIIDENSVLEQLDLIRDNLPEAIANAVEILQNENEIISKANNYADEIVKKAQRRAQELVHDSVIVQQAEVEANNLRQRVQQECEILQKRVYNEIEQMRSQAYREVEQLRKMTIAEAEEIQNGADNYAEAVLNRIEQQLDEMLSIIRNGRQQLHNNSPSYNSDKQLPGDSNFR